jgi:rhodanese-related sulfurtransferase
MEISPSKLNNWLNEIDFSLLHIIDCREQDEWDLCHIKGAMLMPLSVFAELINKFKGSESMTFVIYCHHGMRSLHATHQMRSKGFQNTYSLAGGIERWSYDIDPTIARY